MNRYKTSAELKNLAKDKLDGKYGTAVLILFSAEVISMMLSHLTASLTPFNNIAGYIISLGISLAVSVVSGVLNAGICLFFLNMACGQSFQVSDLFYGFRQQSNKCLILSLVFTLLQFICLTPYQAVSYIILTKPYNIQLSLLMLLLWAVGMLLYVPLSLAISQSFYLVLDFPDLSTKETLQKSIQIMRGHKGRLFYVEMSFLPLMFLCVFTCGIGFLWLMPYMQMTMTLFFLDIMKPASA